MDCPKKKNFNFSLIFINIILLNLVAIMNYFLGDWTSPQYYRDSDSRSSIMTEPESEI